MATVPTLKRDPLQPLVQALAALGSAELDDNVRHIDAAIRSAVKAVLPGRQQKKNVEVLVDAARKAFVRTLRRRNRG